MKKAVFIVLITLLFCAQSKATHVYSIELSYRHLYDSTYEITANFLFFCPFCSGPPQSLLVVAHSDTANITSSFSLNRLPFSANIPIGVDFQDQCTKTQMYYVEEYYYRGNWTSLQKAPDWTFYIDLCCTHPMDNIMNTGIRYQAGLNNFDFPDTVHKNISPLWHTRRPNIPGFTHDTIYNPALLSLCEGMQKPSVQTVREYQGDSVSYKLVTATNNFGSPAVYKGSYSLSNPFPQIGGPITINPLTGMMSFLPGNYDTTGYYGLTIRATEWRKDTVYSGSSYTVIPKEIGFVERNLFIHLNDSLNCYQDTVSILPTFIHKKTTDSSLDVIFTKSDYPTPMNWARIRTNTISSDGSEFRVVDSCNYVAPYDTTVKYIPIKSASWIEQGGFTPKITLKLGDYFGCCSDYHIVTKTGTDLDVLQTECGVWVPAGESARIHIVDSVTTDLGSDKSYCKGALFNRTLDAGSGYQFTYLWNTGDTTQMINASTPGTYAVEVFSQFCAARDTMRITNRNCDSTKTGGGPQSTAGRTEADTTNSTSGISEIESQSIDLYPNPSSGILKLRLSDKNKFTHFEVYSSQGRLIDLVNIEQEIETVDLSSSSKGIYLLRLYGKDESFQTFRIILK